jgi:hypothetical protein
MPASELRIPFPLGGVDTRRGYRDSEPQATRYAKNVTPDDSSESRTRGGSRPGLTKRYSTPLDGPPQYLVRVSSGADTRVYEYLVAGTAQNVFLGKSTPSGTVLPITYTEGLSPISGEILTEDGTELTTEGDDVLVIDDFNLLSVDRNQVIEYAGNVIVGAKDSVLQSGTGTVGTSSLDDAGVADWTTLGIDIAIHWVDITSTNATVRSGTYRISSVASGNLTLASNPMITGAGPIACTYTIRVGVRLLDPTTPNISLLSPTGGFVPVGTDSVAVYRDRVVWAIGRTWYMSRQGDPGDYDYGADPEDPARAIAGNASDAGQPADPIVAMAAAGFDYLIIFAENSIWNMRGDPGYGGQLFNLSKTVGCVAAKAWCYGDSTDIFFLSKDGLYYLPPNASGVPEPLSPDKLPRELRGIDRDNNAVTLAYDPDDGGVLIFVTPRTGEKGSHWWFDVDTKSFWPIDLANNSHQPIDAVTFGGSPRRVRRVVLACLDGFVREWTGSTDDGTPITSYLVLGPYQLSGDDDAEGIVSEIVSILDEQSVAVTIKVYTGDSSEEVSRAAIDADAPLFSVEVSAGRSFTIRPRLRGVAMCLRLESTSVWAFEGAFAKVASLGKRRR